MTNLFKRFFTHKSKFLLIILCLLGMVLSYSCTCRNPNNPDDGSPPPTPTKTFSASVSGTVQDTLRVNSLNKKKDGTEDIKIRFSALKGVTKVENFAVTIEKVEVEDGGLDLGSTPDEYKTYMQYDKDNGVLRFEDEGLKKIGALDSKDTPVDKTVSITFKIDGDEQGSDEITRKFHLIKVKKIGEEDIQGILGKMDGNATYSVGEYDDEKGYSFVLSGGKYDKVQGEYVIKNTSIAHNTYDTFENEELITKCKGSASYYLKKLSETSDDTLEPTNDIKDFINKTYYTPEYNIKWGDNYESTITKIKIKFDLTKATS